MFSRRVFKKRSQEEGQYFLKKKILGRYEIGWKDEEKNKMRFLYVGSIVGPYGENKLRQLFLQFQGRLVKIITMNK